MYQMLNPLFNPTTAECGKVYKLSPRNY